ncbi:MAG: hypothetical protein WKF77_05130 [Planctomycetaceae bacterium]
MIELFQRAVAWLMNRVRVNQIQRHVQDGVPMILKRRRIGGSIMIWFGNRFLALAGSGICMFVRADQWMDWEVHCANLLYPDRPRPGIGPGHAVSSPEAGGISVRQLLRCRQTHGSALVAAARELRRVHQIQCCIYKAAWSHGDLHLDNILYDSAADRAVLIDFDTRHELTFNPTLRHCDDLKVVLLELITMPDEQWHPLATAFIEEYGDSSVLNELSRQLIVPRAFARVLWYTRTKCSPIRRLEPRLRSLREIIRQVTARKTLSERIQVCRDELQGQPLCLPDCWNSG